MLSHSLGGLSMTPRRVRGGRSWQQGDTVYLRPIRHTWIREPFMVVEAFLHKGWPHYRLIDPAGDEWIASQLDLSSTPSAWTDPQNFKRQQAAIR